MYCYFKHQHFYTTKLTHTCTLQYKSGSIPDSKVWQLTIHYVCVHVDAESVCMASPFFEHCGYNLHSFNGQCSVKLIKYLLRH